MAKSKKLTIEDLAAMTQRQFETVQNDIGELRGELDEFRQEMQAGFAEIHSEMGRGFAEVKEAVKVLAGEIAEIKVDHEQRLQDVEEKMRIAG